MKTSELINKLHALGCSTVIEKRGIDNKILVVYNSIDVTISRVPLGEYGQLDTYYTAFPHSSKLLKLLTDYALTEVKEREDTKKYLVQLLPSDECYLNLNKNTGEVETDSCIEVESFQTRFTEKEYRKLQSEYPQWLPEFDQNGVQFILVEV